MQVFEENFSAAIPSELLPDTASQVVFFDIETTGFSGQSARLYLLGCIYYDRGIWRLRQWFLDEPDSEKEMLISFFDFIGAYSWLIHFNGSTFDLPFIEKRLVHYGLARSFDFFQSLDLYKELRPYKKALKLSGLKQKDLEEFLGIHRRDPFTGGELIQVYYEYLERRRGELLSCLLLHNAEDLRGMLSLLPLRGLLLLLQGAFEPVDYQEHQEALTFRLSPEATLPGNAALSFPGLELCIAGDQVTASVPLFRGMLKYFYRNYKDYYYLPEEDQAVHKSVAAYVDKAYRRTATLSNCYTRRSSVFLPLRDKNSFSPVFQTDYQQKNYYMELTEEFLYDKKLQKRYLLQLMKP